MIDVSPERFESSKKELKLHLNNELPIEVAQYVAYVANLLDGDTQKRKAINSSFRLRIERLLRLELSVPSDAVFSAVQKLHECDLFSSDIDPVPWIKKTLFSDRSQWSDKLQDHELFDGVDDMLPMWIWDVFDEFSWFAFLGIAKDTCSDEELRALIENMGENSLSSDVDSEIAIKLIPGLRML